MGPDAVHIIGSVRIRSSPFGTVARVQERDGVDIAVLILIELRKINTLIDQIQRFAQSLVGSCGQPGIIVGIVVFGLGYGDPHIDRGIDGQLAIGILVVHHTQTARGRRRAGGERGCIEQGIQVLDRGLTAARVIGEADQHHQVLEGSLGERGLGRRRRLALAPRRSIGL